MPLESAPASSDPPKAVFADINGMVHPVTTEIVAGAIAMAKRDNASVLVLRLDTPGGLMDAMRDSIQLILASPVPVVTYVAPSGGRSASAGFFILESGDLAAMAPGTNTGAAHPVAEFGEMDSVMKDKVENDAAAYLRSICTKRGRNADLAESAVRQSKSFTEAEALQQHLIDLIAPNDPALLAAIDGRAVTRFNGTVATLHTAGAAIENYSPSWRQRIVSAIADPNIALILLVVGGLCIYLEFTTPGLIAPGIIGAICVLLALSALSVLPINWLGAGLLIVAFTLFVLEAKFASHGVLAVGGAISMILGAVMLVDSPTPEMRVHWGTAIALAIPFAAITVFLLTIALRARRQKVETGVEAIIGQEGAAVTELSPEGKVLVQGDYWDAVSLRPAPRGARIRVTAIDKLKLTVEPIPERSGG
jgi:membrane-bound serine protease (ClpP class)